MNGYFLKSNTQYGYGIFPQVVDVVAFKNDAQHKCSNILQKGK